ncbi:transmembrane protein, putative (macronuclear) [Tetrahymena thermophila SB210]|uniref:Transmembrane protein, putative n=1 Tax=Tetrahymena thermophila (strain SB210) TaxID=312017 RepID=W7X5L3_TETTS|nr:transmembrane protein, putative [Tetrahymena thermophila SB210]EWS74660.1 transmembrane protein, putative [Tetrahymena thermophila SB210]|eukprot:XP_012652803.1 transmembrane protein, putative [Tetrahymena thermophila SB210]
MCLFFFYLHFFIFNICFIYLLIHFLLFHIFSSFFPSKQITNQLISYIFFLQYSKSHNLISDQGTSNFGSAIVNCTNLSNLTLNLKQQRLICLVSFYLILLSFSFYCTCVYFSSIFIFLFSTFALFIYQLINFLLFHIFFSFFPSKQLTNQLINQIFFLQYLKSNNQIGIEGAINLCPAIQNCTNLSKLTLRLCENTINKSQQLKVKSKYLKSKRLVVIQIQFLSFLWPW